MSKAERWLNLETNSFNLPSKLDYRVFLWIPEYSYEYYYEFLWEFTTKVSFWCHLNNYNNKRTLQNKSDFQQLKEFWFLKILVHWHLLVFSIKFAKNKMNI